MGKIQAEKDKEQIKSLFLNGDATITQLTRLYDVDYKYITSLLIEMGVTTPSKVEISESQIRNMKAAGMSKKTIADYYGISIKELQIRLEEEKIDGVFPQKKYPITPNTVEANIEQCEGCRFKAHLSGIGPYCNHIGITGLSRNCKVIDCKRRMPKDSKVKIEVEEEIK